MCHSANQKTKKNKRFWGCLKLEPTRRWRNAASAAVCRRWLRLVATGVSHPAPPFPGTRALAPACTTTRLIALAASAFGQLKFRRVRLTHARLRRTPRPLRPAPPRPAALASTIHLGAHHSPVGAVGMPARRGAWVDRRVSRLGSVTTEPERPAGGLRSPLPAHCYRLPCPTLPAAPPLPLLPAPPARFFSAAHVATFAFPWN